jgi:hypothetical protein
MPDQTAATLLKSSLTWHETSYGVYSLARPSGEIVGSVRRGYRTWFACTKGKTAEYLTVEQAKAAVEREVNYVI